MYLQRIENTADKLLETNASSETDRYIELYKPCHIDIQFTLGLLCVLYFSCN